MCKQLLLFAQTTCSFWTQKNVLAYDVVYQCGGASGTARTREAYPHGVGCIRWFGPARTAASFHRARRADVLCGLGYNFQQKMAGKASAKTSVAAPVTETAQRCQGGLALRFAHYRQKNVGPAIQKQKHLEA